MDFIHGFQPRKPRNDTENRIWGCLTSVSFRALPWLLSYVVRRDEIFNPPCKPWPGSSPTRTSRPRRSTKPACAGFDVESIREIMPGADDDDVLARSIAEQRVLVTFDKDFGDMAFRQGRSATYGVILMRPRLRGAGLREPVHHRRPLPAHSLGGALLRRPRGPTSDSIASSVRRGPERRAASQVDDPDRDPDGPQQIGPASVRRRRRRQRGRGRRVRGGRERRVRRRGGQRQRRRQRQRRISNAGTASFTGITVNFIANQANGGNGGNGGDRVLGVGGDGGNGTTGDKGGNAVSWQWRRWGERVAAASAGPSST